MKALVTGASRGIGKAIVEEFERSGVDVISVSRGDGISISQDGNRIHIGFDYKSFDELGSSLKKSLGEKKIDYVVHNAATLNVQKLDELSLEDFQDHVHINTWNVLELFRSLYKVSLLSKNSHHVSIGSMGGVQGVKKFPGLAAYSISKAALAALTESLHVEYGAEGMAFNYLGLGAVNTEMLRSAFPGYISQVEPENMAKFIVSFSMNSGQLMSGQIISVAKSDPEG